MQEHDRKIVFSSKSDEWSTPQKTFDDLNKLHNFTLDPCATASTAKCNKFYTIEDDGLKKDWTDETVFVNPPYSDCYGWVKKSYEEVKSGKARKVVMLIPARVDTRWFHQFCLDSDWVSEICFYKGRLKFGSGKNSAPFPSMYVVFEKNSVQIKFSARDSK
jgi:phage N-6-adenine-methyltransferase